MHESNDIGFLNDIWNDLTTNRNESIMPQLDQFTYFTQFFWSCLFLFTFYIPKKRSFHLEARLFIFYLGSIRFQRILFFLKWSFFCLFFLRNFFLLVQTISVLLYHTPFLFILPSELNLLEGYLNEAQDPEWVEFVRQRLQIQNHAPRIYESLVRDFINTELCFSTRDKICSMYKLLFYSREDQKFWVDPIDLDCILHVHLEGVEFNLPALHQVLTSLSTEGHESTFYSQVKTRHAHHFHGFLALKEKAALEMQQDLELRQEWIELEKKEAFLQERNALLKRRLGLPE